MGFCAVEGVDFGLAFGARFHAPLMSACIMRLRRRMLSHLRRPDRSWDPNPPVRAGATFVHRKMRVIVL